jgi:seryl-tRNA synthetase
LSVIPNLPADDVPEGAKESANVPVASRAFGTPPGINNPKQHFEIGEALGQMDFERAAKVSGARFVYLKADLARLERALASFMLDTHTEKFGYTEVNPPLLVRDDTMFGTAQLPKFKDDQFATSRGSQQADELFDNIMEWGTKNAMAEARALVAKGAAPADAMEKLEEIFAHQKPEWRMRFNSELEEQLRLWLIPTAEVPLTNLVRESILDEAVKADPKDPHAWYALGMAHHTLGEGEALREVARHLLRFDPKMARRLIQDTGASDLAPLVADLLP